VINKNPSLGRFFFNFFSISLSSLLMALSFPGVFSGNGIFLLAFISLFPVFYTLPNIKLWQSPLYGIWHAFLFYILFNYWLTAFHPLAIFIVPVIFVTYAFILFPLLKLAQSGRVLTWLLQSLLWVSYEYLRTKGFLGYSYGILGYSQAPFTGFIQSADLWGVWGVTLLVVIPSAFLGNCLKDGQKGFFLKKNKISFILIVVLFVSNGVYGILGKVDYSESNIWKTALIQQNVDPWHGGYDAYRKGLDILKKESISALDHNLDILIWSETAFVPAIRLHSQNRDNPQIYGLVKELKDFSESLSVPIMTGNDDGIYYEDANGKRIRKDYNAAVLLKNGIVDDLYHKIHLVPFTENFPYENQLPWIYRKLKEADTHFWEKGDELTVFESNGVYFSTPICFEDTFGCLVSRFVASGAQVIVNLTNDAWSGSVASEKQHMAMGLFRSVENRRSTIRSTNGGITCLIDPNGIVLNEIPPFEESYMIAEVPVYDGKLTVYTKYGDWFAILIIVLTAGIGLFSFIHFLRRVDNQKEV